MKLPVQIGSQTKCIFASLALLLTHPIAFSSPTETKSVYAKSLHEAPAEIKKTEKENTFVYSFSLKSVPETDLLNNSLERFRQIEGFISLSVNSGNEVELVTKNTISEQDNARLLSISARLYGYPGYEIH